MIIVSSNATEAFSHLHNLIVQDGTIVSPRGERTREISPVEITLTFPECREVLCTGRKFRIDKAYAELLWYMSADPRTDVIERFLPRWAGYSDEKGNVNSNYGIKWREQVPDVIAELRTDRFSRRAVMMLLDYDRHRWNNPKDVPCTLAQQFVLRDGLLHMHVTMRSCDLWWGFCNDQHAFTILMCLLANELGVRIGNYYHRCTSMHVYERHWEKRIEHGEESRAISTGMTFSGFWDQIIETSQPDDLRDDVVENLGLDSVIAFRKRFLSLYGDEK